MPKKKPYTPYKTGINFHPVVKRYLDRLSQERGLTRCDVVTAVVMYYAETHGTPLDLTESAEEERKRAA
jgi:hypothetical protein